MLGSFPPNHPRTDGSKGTTPPKRTEEVVLTTLQALHFWLRHLSTKVDRRLDVRATSGPWPGSSPRSPSPSTWRVLSGQVGVPIRGRARGNPGDTRAFCLMAFWTDVCFATEKSYGSFEFGGWMWLQYRTEYPPFRVMAGQLITAPCLFVLAFNVTFRLDVEMRMPPPCCARIPQRSYRYLGISQWCMPGFRSCAG